MSKLGRLLSVIIGGFVIAILYANCDKNESNTQPSIWPGGGKNVTETFLVVALPQATDGSATTREAASRMKLTDYVRRWLYADMTDSEWDDSQFKLMAVPTGASVYSDDTGSRALVRDAEFDELFVKLDSGVTGTVQVQLKRPVNSATTKTLKLVVSSAETHSVTSGGYTVSGPRSVMAGQKALFVVSKSSGGRGSFSGSFGIEQGGVKGAFHSSCCEKSANTEGMCKKVTTRKEGQATANVNFCLSLPSPSGWEWDDPKNNVELERQKEDRYYSEDASLPLPHYAFVQAVKADNGTGFNVALRKKPSDTSAFLALRNIRIHEDLTSLYQVSVQRQMCSANMNAGDCGKAGGVHSGTGSSERCNCDDAGDGAAREALVMTWPCPTSANKIQKNNNEKCAQAQTADTGLSNEAVMNYRLYRCKMDSARTTNPNCGTSTGREWAEWKPASWGSGASVSSDVVSTSSAAKKCVYIGSTPNHDDYFMRYTHHPLTDGASDCTGFTASGDNADPAASRSGDGKYVAVVVPLGATGRGDRYKYRVERRNKQSNTNSKSVVMSCSGTGDNFGTSASCVQDAIRLPKPAPTNFKLEVAKGANNQVQPGAIKLSWKGSTEVTLGAAAISHSYKIQMCKTDEATTACSEWSSLPNVGSANNAMPACSKAVSGAPSNGKVGVKSDASSTAEYLGRGAKGSYFDCTIVDLEPKFYRFRIYDANKIGDGAQAAGVQESSPWLYARLTPSTRLGLSEEDAQAMAPFPSIGTVSVKKIAASGTAAQPAKIQLSWPCPPSANRDWTCEASATPSGNGGWLVSDQADRTDASKAGRYRIYRCQIEDSVTTGLGQCGGDAWMASDEDYVKKSYKVAIQGTGSGAKLIFEDKVTSGGSGAGAFADGENAELGKKYVYKIRVYNELGIMSTPPATCAGPASLPTAPSACTGTTGITAPAQ